MNEVKWSTITVSPHPPLPSLPLSLHRAARRLINESFQPAIVLEVILYDWSRGSGYSGSYAAPGTSDSSSAERRAETEETGAAGGRGDPGTGVASRSMDPLVEMSVPPCSPRLLLGDGDVYEEEEEDEEGGGAGLTLVRGDGKVVQGRGGSGGGGASGEGGGDGGIRDLLSADELACDVGGLDGQLEDIVRRVLSTRALPAEVRGGGGGGGANCHNGLPLS